MQQPSHRRRSKRKDAARAFIYLLMFVAVLVIVAILMLVISGYRLNQRSGTWQQGGLVQFDSRPGGAEVYVNDARLANRTPNKITVAAGTHTFKITRQGYHDWTKQATVAPGGILWLNYARMIPTELATEQTLTFKGMTSVALSENRKLYALTPEATSPEIIIANIDADTPKAETVPLAVGSYTAPSEGKTSRFEAVRWDYENRYVLVKHTYDDTKTEWLVVDSRSTDNTFNLTTTLGVDIARAEFVLGNNRAMYVQTEQHELRRIDLGARTLSAVLVHDVTEFTQYDRSTVTYATRINETTKQRGVGYYTEGAASPRVVKSIADNGEQPLHIAVDEYYGKAYVAIAHGEHLEITTGELPASDAKEASQLQPVTAVTVPGGVAKLGFSPGEHRYVYAENAAGASVYDLELDALSTTPFDNQTGKALYWVDAQHFVTVSAGVAIHDFDGNNAHVLDKNTMLAPAAISPNNKYLYHFAQTESGVSLQRVRLLLD